MAESQSKRKPSETSSRSSRSKVFPSSGFDNIPPISRPSRIRLRPPSGEDRSAPTMINGTLECRLGFHISRLLRFSRCSRDRWSWCEKVLKKPFRKPGSGKPAGRMSALGHKRRCVTPASCPSFPSGRNSSARVARPLSADRR